MSYNKLATHFKARTPYKYNKEVHFNGTKIIATERSWVYEDGRWQVQRGTDEIVLAEHIEHNGKVMQLSTIEVTSVLPQRSWLGGSTVVGEVKNSLTLSMAS